MSPDLLNEISIAIATVVINVVFFLRALAKNNKVLHEVKSEVRPNGGGSMADSVGRIEKEIIKLSYWMSAFQNLYEKPIFKTDEHGHNIWANNAYTRLMGVSPRDLEGHGWLTYIDESDRPRVRTEWDSCVTEGRVFDMVYHITNKITDKLIAVRGVAYPIIVKGQVLGHIGTLSEI